MTLRKLAHAIYRDFFSLKNLKCGLKGYTLHGQVFVMVILIKKPWDICRFLFPSTNRFDKPRTYTVFSNVNIILIKMKDYDTFYI